MSVCKFVRIYISIIYMYIICVSFFVNSVQRKQNSNEILTKNSSRRDLELKTFWGIMAEGEGFSIGVKLEKNTTF